MSVKAVEFDPPIPGRMVWGSLYTPNTKDFDGNPLVIKKGPDAGKPTQRYEFGLAVPKTQAHFANEPGWGQLIWATAHSAFPNNPALMAPLGGGDFSWKIVDGDSAVIAKKSKSKIPPNQREGFPGHWILTFSSSFAPKIYDARNLAQPVPLEGEDAIVPGYYVLVAGSVAGNTGNTPGVYLNHNAVALRGYMPVIQSAGAFDVSKFGKAAAALPAGVTAAPVGSAALPKPAAPVTPAAAPPLAAASVYTPPPAAAAPFPTAVVPAPSLAGIPVASAVPAPPPALPVALPTHKGHPIQAYLSQGWTMDQLRADGYAG